MFLLKLQAFMCSFIKYRLLHITLKEFVLFSKTPNIIGLAQDQKSLAQKNIISYINQSNCLHCNLIGLYTFVLKGICEKTFYEIKEVKVEFCFDW